MENQNFYGIVSTKITRESLDKEQRTFNYDVFPLDFTGSLRTNRETLKGAYFDLTYNGYEDWGAKIYTDKPTVEVLGIARFISTTNKMGDINIKYTEIEEIYFKDRWYKKASNN